MTSATAARFDGPSACLFCGSSDLAASHYLEAAQATGVLLAREGWRLVYGGGGVGLMGAAARGAHAAGGKVLGVMPAFLRDRERMFDDVETLIVDSMHQRKTLMYDQSDVFIVAPGGIGTLEEVIEVLSWKRLGLHDKPVVFLNLEGFWDGLIEVLDHGVNARLTPPEFHDAWDVCDSVDALRLFLETVRPPAVAAGVA